MTDKKTRVVVTGLGIVSPLGNTLADYENALREQRSGIRFIEKLAEANFRCQVAGVPPGIAELQKSYFSEEQCLAINSNMTHAGIAAVDCWADAGLPKREHNDDDVDWDTGAIIGSGIGGLDTAAEKLIPKTDAGKVRRLGSTLVEQVMASSNSALVGGLLGLGGQLTTNSSACTTGTEAIADAYHKIKEGHAKRMLAGGSEGASHYIWAGFDAMRVLSDRYNDSPEEASRPMSATAAGFVPGSGAGILMLESLESAEARGARIYAEMLSGNVNSGGQRGGGTMTAPNPEGVVRCIRGAIEAAGISPKDIDVISGHLTATMADPLEVENWRHALDVSPADFPWINSTKSLLGHGLGAAGGIECVAAILQLKGNFVHGSANCEDLHPKLAEYAARIPHQTVGVDAQIIAKASFGFGDVNGCVIFRKWN